MHGSVCTMQMNRSIKRSHICSASRDAERLEGWWEGLQNQIRVRQGFGTCLCLVVCAPTPVRVPVWIVGCTYPAPPCRQAKHAAIPPCVCVRTPECTEVAGEAQKVRKKKLGKNTHSRPCKARRGLYINRAQGCRGITSNVWGSEGGRRRRDCVAGTHSGEGKC